MNLGQGFNLNDLPVGDSTGDYPSIPAGDYTAAITESSLEDTRAGTGQYIKLRFDISGPTHAGRVMYTNLNIRNPSQQAEQIGQQQLGELMRAIGLSSVTDTDQLIGHSLVIRVAKSKESNPDYADAEGFRNDVKGFKSVGGNSTPAPAQSSTPPAAASSGDTPPWMS